jgi:hypothetical protein
MENSSLNHLPRQKQENNRHSHLSIFAKLGRAVYRYRIIVLLTWAVMLLLSLTHTADLERTLKGLGTVNEAGEASLPRRSDSHL